MTDMLERAARALAQEDLGAYVDVGECADEESDPLWTFYIIGARVSLGAAFKVDDKDARIFFGHRLAEVDWEVNEFLGRKFCDGMQGLREELERMA